MKALVTVLCFLFSASAFAALDFSQGQQINRFEINNNKSKFSGTVTIAKAQLGENIRLHVMAPIDCPPGRACAAVMEEIELNAEVISISKVCGSIVYQALTDGTPYDGPKTEITVQDHSHRMCRDMRRGLVEVDAKVSVLRTQHETKYFGYQVSEPIENQSELSRGVKMDSVKLTGSESGGRNGFVQVKGKSVLVKYSYNTCSDHGVCLAVMSTREIKLKLVSKKDDGCGSIVYKAAPAQIIPGGSYSQVTITDNTKRLCEDVVRARLVVEGSTSYPYPGRKPVTFEMLK